MKKLTAEGDYTMPVLSEQEQEDIAAECRRLIAEAEKQGAGYRAQAKGTVARVAIAALTAKTYAYADAKAINRMLTGRVRFFTAFPEESASKRIALYISPSVPVKQEGEQ